MESFLLQICKECIYCKKNINFFYRIKYFKKSTYAKILKELKTISHDYITDKKFEFKK